MFVGIDDTDSPKGMCTTFICKMIMDELADSFEIIGFPKLIRLNPNIPYKTRGNGALSFEIKGDPRNVMSIIKDTLTRFFMDDPRTNPGVVLIDGEVPPILNDFYIRALHDVIEIGEAHDLAADIGAETLKYGNGRGVIGALASIGSVVPDPTFELIAYRLMENIGKPRYVDDESVKEIDIRYHPRIFDSYDWHNKYIAISPNAPCPVLYGIRGDDWRLLEEASCQLVTEPIFKKQIFFTNQATDAHIEDKKISDIQEFSSVHLCGKVTNGPRYEHKGHVFMGISDDTGDIICAAYEPTKEFRNVVSQLVPCDEVEVWGGIKRTSYGLTLNLEKLTLRKLVAIYKNIVPSCCGKKMQSIGAGKGYRCRSCNKRISEGDVEKALVEREITEGPYEVPVIARRHLARPLCRL